MKRYLLLLLLPITTQAQNACTLNFQKDQKLHFSRVDAPQMIIEIPDYFTLKGKKKDAAEAKFRADVAEGKIAGKSYDFDMRVSDTKSYSDGNLYEFEYATPTAKYYSYIVCARDTMFSIRSKKGTAMVSGTDTIGFMKLGLVQYPLKMKVGDVLPVTTDLAYTFPKNFDMSYKRQVLDHVDQTSWVTESQGLITINTSTTSYYKEVTKNLTYTIQFSAPTLTYRHVIAEEDITYNGKSYKAMKIQLDMQTRVEDMIKDVEADEQFMKWTLEFTNNLITKKVNKSEDLKNTGFEWFVPELGMIVVSEIKDKDGNPMYKSILKNVN